MSDGGKAKILALKVKRGEEEITASMNDEKSKALAKGFFPTKPQEETIQENGRYPKACSKAGKILAEQIQQQLWRIKPFKAPGPDSIPNIVLSKSTDLIVDRLYYIYKAMLERKLLYKPWKASTMVVLRKLGKPCYDRLKAYRPIALLNTMWKVLMAIVANHITFLAEKHQLLPANHFGGRPG